MNREYPRPNLYRDNILLLDGEWFLDGQVVEVPYPPQSELSGYQGEVPDRFTYSKWFEYNDLPKSADGRYILHFGAVDQICRVFINDILLGEHKGGYLSFEYDITDGLYEDNENNITVEVTDELDVTYPYGKQCKKPHSMWYTPVSGIWKSVYIEAVPSDYITGLYVVPTASSVELSVSTSNANKSGTNLPNNSNETEVAKSAGKTKKPSLTINIYEGVVLSAKEYDLYEYVSKDRLIYSPNGSDITITADTISEYLGKPYELKLWDEYTPTLYPIEVIYGDDKVYSYIAFREIEIKTIDDVPRLCINGKPAFMHGVLDQGYFKDGILTPGEYKEYDRDILRMKKLGFNTLRKHIKVEAAQFYYSCDRLGMYVVQDMVNSGKYHYVGDTIMPTFGGQKRRDDFGKNKDWERKDFFIEHSIDTLRELHNYPSIICYTIFNEGWGQFEADLVYEIMKSQDPTRLYDATSGWFKQTMSDFDSRHVYFKSKKLEREDKPLFLSECGGFSYAVEGHDGEGTRYGYGACPNENALTYKVNEMYKEMVYPAIKEGLCGCIYTQLSDVENEINGLYTYDRIRRKVIKSKMLDIRARIDDEMAKIT